MIGLKDIDGLNLNHLFYFHIVASEGSIAAASRALRVSQSTMSEQIRELESALGEPLFSRTGRTLMLNDAGRLVLEQTEVMLTAAARLVQQFRPEAGATQTLLRVGYASSIARAQVASDLLPLFTLPSVNVRVHTSEPAQLTQSLLHGELDLVLTDQRPPEAMRSSLSYEALPGCPLVAVVAQRHVDNQGSDAFRSLPLFQYSVSSRFRFEVEQWLRRHELRPQLLGEADDVGLLLAATRAGRCFAVVPQAALMDGGAGLHVVETLPDTTCERFAVYQGGEPLDLVREAVALLTKHGDFVPN